MRKLKSVLFAALCLLAAQTIRAVEGTWEYSVQVSASVQTSPAQITLSWPQDNQVPVTSYTVYRKTLTGTSWGAGTPLSGSTTSYVDNNVSPGQAYEYQIVKVTSVYNGYGYIYAGINAPLIESRGKLVLMVDNTVSASLSNELARLEQDMVGDGWTVLRHDVSPSDSVPSVKATIQAEYNADPANVQAVFLFGHVPVPYSGDIVPDGHIPNHQGAWPADAYYGDMQGVWTDNSVNDTGADDPRNHNVPGDGKFDQSTIPGNVDLMVGRVDLTNMPGQLVYNGPATFPGEISLLRNYLNKDHKFRINQTPMPQRGLVGDYFGIRSGEAFAASGWRNFAPFFGASNVTSLPTEGTWIPALASTPYLWAYGCGAGSFTSVGGIGNTGQYNDGTTTDLYSADAKSVFFLLFGSWLGDWDSQDNIMRCVLALPTYGLTCAWSGRPHWFLHHMALGMPIGYGARLTQNNQPGGLYQNQINTAANEIHIALMGDPTLRMHPVSPVGSLTSTLSSGSAQLSWTAAADTVVGYHVYRAPSLAGPFTRLTSSPLTSTSYVDSTAGSSNYLYMVRSVKLQTSASGTYYNPGEGVFVMANGQSITPLSTTGTTTPPPVTTNTPPPVTTNSPPPVTSTNTSPSGTITNAPGAGAVTWVDDSTPSGAVLGTAGGDSWDWISSNPAPYSGTLAHQSAIATGMHQQYFDWAGNTLTVTPGNELFTYVYLDPAHVPSEILLEWNDGTWAHRAYWGANDINNGTNNSPSRHYMGALPPAGQWEPLIVPASAVNLDGSTLRGMTFTLFNGRATWDYTGTAAISGTTTPPPVTTNTPPPVTTNSPPPVTSTNTSPSGTITNAPDAGAVTWVDDSTPSGAVLGTAGGDSWDWISSNPAPYSGTLAHQSAIATGMHQQYFDWAGNTLTVTPGNELFTYVYLDPAHVPSEILLEWNDGTWAHRAYWGANDINNGTNNTPSRHYMGALPPAGQWEPLIVPASAVNLDGSTLRGMTFTLFNGRATWDYTGTAAISGTNTPPPVTTNSPPPVTSTNTSPSGTITNAPGAGAVTWVDDSTPSGAVLGTAGGDSWDWISSNPAPYSGTLAHQSAIATGMHQQYFDWAGNTLTVTPGNELFTYVYLDPAHVPSEILLEWNDGTWAHRAYWGANDINNGTNNTPSRHYMGALPPAGQWEPLIVPASAVNLDGSTLRGMTFTLFNGRATWDYTGTAAISGTNTPPPVTTNSPPPVTGTNTNSSTLSSQSIKLTNGTAIVSFVGIANDQYNAQRSTNMVAWTTLATITAATNGLFSITDSFSDLGGHMPASAYYRALLVTNTTPTNTFTNNPPVTVNVVDDLTLQLPQPGDNALHVLSPSMLELVHINTQPSGSSQVTDWNFVNSSGQFQSPSTSQISVTVDGKAMAVQSIGFKRRPLYANNRAYDLLVENSLYLQLSGTITNNQKVVVQNPDGSLWGASSQFTNSANPLRFSPVIHVNQEGYVPSLPKQAMIGYYLGSLGEMNIPASAGFVLVDASSGASVYQGSLTSRPDTGWNYSPAPYQKVLMADFSSFTTAGEYQLVVPGYGASLPFLINDGIAMDFTRACALGLYSQRCGTNNTMPYTRFTRGVCHAAPASIPVPESNFAFTWNTIATYNTGGNVNPSQTAPTLSSQATSLYPFINTGTVDVSGGHHDAGDYSKYTINVASLVHFLMFAVDSFPGVAAMDNLGIPESGDGISDVMQEAKWEADFLSKMQDADGGFYFLVYPQNREYESNVTPDHGDPQVVWPKNTSVTAASVAALAQCASSPTFKKQYPAAAALYMQKANLGWKFLTNAIAKYGLVGSYQKITFYGDDFTHNDELAWAATEMYLATGNSAYQQTLLSWFNPADSNTWRWGWWHMAECYGNAIRSYAFAVKSGRLQASQLDATFLSKCQAEIAAAANDALTWSQQSSYGTSFPQPTKAVNSAGWYFGGDYAFDLAVGYQLNQNTNYLTAMLANMNYEGGCNPVNVSYVAGLGWKRGQMLVSQMAENDGLTLPPSGLLVGNIQQSFPPMGWPNYGNTLEGLCYPSDGASTAPYPFYDRWGDSWNVTTEMITLNEARDLVSHAFLSTLTSTKSQAYVAQAGTISLPAQISSGSPVTATFHPPSGMDLSGARIVWESSSQQPAYGTSYTFTPANSASFWLQAEAQWPDGRRSFAVLNNQPTITVAASGATVSRATQNNGTWTFTRTGNTSAALTVNLAFTGTAAQWTDYRTIQGSMPSTVTFAAGSSTTTMTIYAVAGTAWTGSETATVNVSESASYNVGSSGSATITLN